ncbi:MAG: HD domain-containing protein [Armatimonadetes bacterium]|nr:HD domain-containing protein [Armatimonadota bacterium]
MCKIALRVAAIYVLAAALWETYADDLLLEFVGSREELERLFLTEGMLFIGLTSIAVYIAVRLNVAKMSQAQQRLRKSEEDILWHLGQVAEWRDDETGDHTLRVGEYCSAIAHALGWPHERCELVRKAGILHDIGKIGIPDSVMMKVGDLEDEERSLMQSHTLMGADLLCDSQSPLLRMASCIAASHHERWDGTGYPYELAGEDIPIEGRITAVADVFDALVSRRRYKEAWSYKDAVREIESLAGTRFDPKVVEAFLVSLTEIKEIYTRYSGTAKKIGVNRAA